MAEALQRGQTMAAGYWATVLVRADLKWLPPHQDEPLTSADQNAIYAAVYEAGHFGHFLRVVEKEVEGLLKPCHPDITVREPSHE